MNWWLHKVIYSVRKAGDTNVNLRAAYSFATSFKGVSRGDFFCLGEE